MLLLLLVTASIAASATAPTPPAAPPQRPPVDCHDETHRAVEFWVGEWNVSDTRSSTPIAQSRIEWLADGCAIRETYTQTVGPNGAPMDYLGTSYTAYNTLAGEWQQFYVDSKGAVSRFSGTLAHSALVMTAPAGSVTNRMTVSAQGDGSVRQRGEISTDGGKTWQPGYDFIYRRK